MTARRAFRAVPAPLQPTEGTDGVECNCADVRLRGVRALRPGFTAALARAVVIANAQHAATVAARLSELA